MATAMERVNGTGFGSAARWVIVALLAMVAGMLLAALVLSPAPAVAQPGPAHAPATGSGGQGGVLAVAGQVTGDTYGLYLVDLQNGTICLYQYVSGERCLQLVAARTFVYDRQLDEYNTKPKPRDVAKLVTEARRMKDTTQPSSP